QHQGPVRRGRARRHRRRRARERPSVRRPGSLRARAPVGGARARAGEPRGTPVTDPRLLRYAALIYDYSLELQPGPKVLIRSQPAVEPLVVALAREAWVRGADPSVWLEPPTAADRVLREGSDDQLRHCSPIAVEMLRTFDAAINVLAPTNDRARS